MTENDWDVLLAWNNDPEVLWFSEGDDIGSRTLDEVQLMYRAVSASSSCFIIEHQDRPIGECWLQRMNVGRVIDTHPGNDVRRIDISIGEKELWGRGLGTESVELLMQLAFQSEACDLIYEPEIADFNVRSRRMFERLGFEEVAEIPQAAGSKAAAGYDLALTSVAYFQAKGTAEREDIDHQGDSFPS